VFFDAAALVLLWTWGMWRYVFRSWTTVAVLTLTSVAYLVITQLPPPANIVKFGTVALAVAAMVSNPHLFWALPPEQRRFERVYVNWLERLQLLGSRRLAGDISPAEFASGLQALEAELRETVAPDAEWDSLRADSVTHLERQRERYQAMATSSDATPAVGSAGQDGDARRVLAARHDRARRGSYSFWRR
jgi:hypothetical protein